MPATLPGGVNSLSGIARSATAPGVTAAGCGVLIYPARLRISPALGGKTARATRPSPERFATENREPQWRGGVHWAKARSPI